MSLTSQKEQIESNNRRHCPRGTFRGAVLVFFGLGKWGKLINISEGGMAFEFYELPPSGERLNFALEIMDREPSERSGDATDSIHADGQVVWAHNCERCVGIQFVDISGATRQQIRQRLAIEPSSGAGAEGEKVQGDAIETRLTRPPLTRAALMSMVRWLAVLAMLGGITTMILSQRVHLAALFESIRERSIGNNTPPRAGERSVVKTPLGFQVEAVDMNNRRRLLTFMSTAS